MRINIEILSISDKVPRRNRTVFTTASVVKKVPPRHSNTLLTWHQIFRMVCIFRRWMNSKHFHVCACLWERQRGISSTASWKNVRLIDIRNGEVPSDRRLTECLSSYEHLSYKSELQNNTSTTYRSFATRVSQFKIWHFWVIGTERNVCRCTFKRYSVIKLFAKLAAGEQLCRRCTHRKL